MNDVKTSYSMLFFILIITIIGSVFFLNNFIKNYVVSFIIISWALCFIFLGAHSEDVAKLAYLSAGLVLVFMIVRIGGLLYPALAGSIILLVYLIYMYRPSA